MLGLCSITTSTMTVFPPSVLLLCLPSSSSISVVSPFCSSHSILLLILFLCFIVHLPFLLKSFLSVLSPTSTILTIITTAIIITTSHHHKYNHYSHYQYNHNNHCLSLSSELPQTFNCRSLRDTAVAETDVHDAIAIGTAVYMTQQL